MRPRRWKVRRVIYWGMICLLSALSFLSYQLSQVVSFWGKGGTRYEVALSDGGLLAYWETNAPSNPTGTTMTLHAGGPPTDELDYWHHHVWDQIPESPFARHIFMPLPLWTCNERLNVCGFIYATEVISTQSQNINAKIIRVPCWPFYALPLLIEAERVLRRRRRAKNGRCPICYHDLSAGNTCPECGTTTEVGPVKEEHAPI